MHSEPKFIKEEFKKAYKAVVKTYKSKHDFPITCEIHDYLSDSKNHNCIGCNFADTEEMIINNIKKYRTVNDLREAYTIHLLLCYLMVERMDEIFKIINLPDSYKSKHFQATSIIRKWANFIKHPKAFLLVHHPEFILENDPALNKFKSGKIEIDTKFINTYYSGKDNNSKLYSLLTNKKDVVVIVPEIATLTGSFFVEIRHFIELIRDNSVYRHVLKDKSTLNNFFIGDEGL